MTASTIEYALMAGAAYKSTRSDSNRISYPEGWNKLDPAAGLDFRQDDLTGFEAVAFIKGNDIVISYAGTYDKSLADKAADVALAAGILDPQLTEKPRSITKPSRPRIPAPTSLSPAIRWVAALLP